MRYLVFALLIMAAACAQQGNSGAQPNTMLDPITHDAFFPISGGEKHAMGSDNPPITCNSCHGSSSSFKQFDCLSCHQHSDQAALTLAHRSLPQFAYVSASCYSCHPRGTAAGAAPAGITGDPTRTITVNAQIPSYSGTSISTLTPQTETLPMQMNHASTQVDSHVFARCSNCHANASAGAFYPGNLHGSLAALKLPEPSGCTDCHSTMPNGLVGPTATNPARTPASGEMKHDAVLWNSSGPTATNVVSQDCAVCHVTPTTSMPAGKWGTNPAGTTPALFHASLTAAGVAQPGSCVDCHANSRPKASVTVAGTGVSFDHGAAVALADCQTCHQSSASSQFASWAGGKFHLAGTASPSTCLPCHAAERPTSTAGWVKTVPQASPFDYVPVAGTTPAGVTHGDGQDCVTCHSGPGTGTWGGTGASAQNWVGGSFTHGAGTISATTCFACHTTQRPDIVYTAATAKNNLPGNFDHSLNGTGDCFGCHQATATRASPTYVTYWDGSAANANRSDWAGGLGYPGATLIGAPNQFTTATETTLNRSGPNNLVTSTTSILATLNNAMLHTSAMVPWSLGSPTNPTNTNCYHCHTASNTATGSPYANGQFHSRVTAAGLAQPTQCLDCHAQMRPTAIVENTATVDLQPMDHNAVFTSAAVIGGVSVTGVSGIECAVCHKNPGGVWTDGTFHKNIGTAVPQDCTTCHYPLMADAAKSDIPSGVNYTMQHRSGGLTVQNCQVCHASGLSRSTTTPIVSTLWQTGALHASLGTQPSACVACHAGSEPAAGVPTQSSWSYNFANGGGTSSNTAQWMNHGAPDVTGKDCVTCHAADAKQSGSAWSKADYFHTAVAKPASCQTCHGLTNGGGSVAGTNNNLPSGLTNSSTVTMASNDTGTGVSVGTHDQISHADINVSSHDCSFCHTQAGLSNTTGIKGSEWAQANFHSHFSAAAGTPLILNSTTGRCSNCHMNVRPVAGFPPVDHTAFTATSGSQDCGSCHSYPGTGTATAPNWYGASFDHSKNFPIAAADKHNSAIASCASCHANQSTPTDLNTINCIGCHSNASTSVDVGGVDSRHKTPVVQTTIAGYAFTSLACLKCHAGTVSAPNWTDPLKFTLAQHSSSCFGILNGDHSVSQTRGNTPICFTCHNAMNTTSKTWGVNWAVGQCAPCHNDGRTATCK